jgi:hypothetical protein
MAGFARLSSRMKRRDTISVLFIPRVVLIDARGEESGDAIGCSWRESESVCEWVFFLVVGFGGMGTGEVDGETGM